MADEKMNEEYDEEEDSVIELVDEDGKYTKFEHIATLDYKDEWYILLQPVVLEDDMDEDEMFIFKIGTDMDGNDLFVPVEDEETLQGVYNVYLEEAGACEDDCDCCDHDCGHHHDANEK